MNYTCGSHAVDWIALAAVLVALCWLWRTSKVRFY